MERQGDTGFTLFEVVVALTVAVACLASFYQIYTLGWRGMRIAGLDQAAIEVARNQLASAGVETLLQEGNQSGVSADGIAWSTDIERYKAPDGFDADRPGIPSAFWVKVKVMWRDGPGRSERSLELRTLKLTSAP